MTDELEQRVAALEERFERLRNANREVADRLLQSIAAFEKFKEEAHEMSALLRELLGGGEEWKQ